MGKEINHIKIILIENHRTGMWLAETLLDFAEVLDCDIKDLLSSTKQ